MSEATKESKQRVPYVVEVEPSPFDSDGKMRYMTSLELCRAVNKYFCAAFADYYGCVFEMTSGPATMTLYFDHIASQDNGVYACSRPTTSEEQASTVITKLRARDRQLREGDRYTLTEDGKDIIFKLIIPRLYNQGKPDIRKFVTDVYDNGGYAYGNISGVQRTKVTGIDLNKLCQILWGKKDPETGDIYEYSVDVKGDLNRGMGFMNQNPNYFLMITQANSTHLVDTYQKLGIATAGSSIVH